MSPPWSLGFWFGRLQSCAALKGESVRVQLSMWCVGLVILLCMRWMFGLGRSCLNGLGQRIALAYFSAAIGFLASAKS